MRPITFSMKNVSFGYTKDRTVLQELTLAAEGKETIGLIGANGAGKSTLLKLLVGLLPDYTGEIQVEKLPVQKKNLPEIRSRIGYVFQDSESQLFMNTVYEDVAFAPRNYGLPEDTVQKRVEEALKQTGTEYLRDRSIYRMSGGEKKLVAIATVLSMTPDILLMDEPSVALDPRNRRNLIRILRAFPNMMILASHDLDLILDTCERTVLMADGRIIRDGRSREILTDRELLMENGLELPLSLQKTEFNRS